MKRINLRELLEEEHIDKIMNGYRKDTTNGNYKWTNIFKDLTDHIYAKKVKEPTVYKGKVDKIHGKFLAKKLFNTDEYNLIVVPLEKSSDISKLIDKDYLFLGRFLLIGNIGDRKNDNGYVVLSVEDSREFSRYPVKFLTGMNAYLNGKRQESLDYML